MFSTSDLFFASSFFEQLLIFIITCLLIIAFIWIIQQILHYRTSEQQALALAQRNLETYQPKPHSTLHNHYQTVIKNCSPKTWIYQQIDYLFHIIARQQSIHIPSILQFVPNKEKTIWGNHLVANLNKILLLLGSIGLLYGSLNFLDNLRLSDLGILFSGDTAMLKQVSSIFTPLETGFFVFFYSIFAMLFAKVGTMLLYWQQNQLTNQIANFTSQDLIPLFSPIKEEVKFAQLIQEVATNTKSINEVAHKLTKTTYQLTADYEQIQAFSQTFQKAVTAHTEIQALWHKDIVALTDLIASYKEKIERSTADNLSIIDGLHKHNKTIATLNKKLYDTEFNVGDWLKDIIALSKKQQAGFKETLKHLLDLTRGNLSTIQSISNRFGNSIRKFEGNLKSLEGVLEHYDGTMRELSQHEMKRLSEVSTKLTATNDSLEQLKESVPNHLAQLIHLIENTNQTTDPAFIEKIATTIADYRIKEQIQAYEEAKKQEALALEATQKEQKGGLVKYVKERFLK